MAHLAGTGGSVVCTNVTLGVRSWALDWAVDELDTTDFGDAGLMTALPGIKRAMATLEVLWDNANTLAPGDTVSSLILKVSDSYFYTVTSGFCVSHPIQSEVAGVTTATYTIRITSAVTPTLA